MKDLIHSEWRRFRRLTLIFAGAHALALLFLARLTVLPQLAAGDQGAMLFVYLLTGVALALVQVGSYRAPSRWLWLMHRPLSPARIFASLATAAGAMLAVGVLLPLLLALVAIDLFTTQLVDSRHYAALLHVMAFAAMAWLAGAHASVSRNKAAIAVLVAPLLLALHLASVWWLLPLVLACTAWLAVIAWRGFRADRDAAVAGTGVLLLTALPLQLAFFLLVFHLSRGAIELAEVLRTSRAHTETTLATTDEPGTGTGGGSFAAEFIRKGLAHSTDPRAAAWREQLPLLEVGGLITDVDRFPVRHQLGNTGKPWWDETSGTEWTFSHDRMLYHGREPRTGEDRGWWGTDGAGDDAPYTQVPSVATTRDTLYAIDKENARQHVLLTLAPGEAFTGRPVRALDRTLVVTSRRVLAYVDDRAAASPFAAPRLDWEVALPEGRAHLVQVDVAALMDGWLVSLFFDPSREYGGFEAMFPPWQRVLFVDAGGTATDVGGREGVFDHRVSWGGAPLVPSASWWASPVLHLLARAPTVVLDLGLTRPPTLEPVPRVRAFVPLAAALMVLSLALGAWWLRGTRASPARRRVWLASCALLGLPALLSLLCLERRAAR